MARPEYIILDVMPHLGRIKYILYGLGGQTEVPSDSIIESEVDDILSDIMSCLTCIDGERQARMNLDEYLYAQSDIFAKEKPTYDLIGRIATMAYDILNVLIGVGAYDVLWELPYFYHGRLADEAIILMCNDHGYRPETMAAITRSLGDRVTPYPAF